jgi:RNA polymerase sigma-70 factor (ECF subfamily)
MDNAILTLSTAPQLAPDEEAAIERSLAGDLNAFNQLVVKYQRLAYSVAYRMLQTEDAAADAVQDSFIKAYRALSSFKGGVFKSWLLRIVVNTCYDVLRAQKRYTFEPIGEESDEETPVTLLVDKGESPQDYVERMELNDLIELGIRSLPADQRLVLTLCDVHGYAYEEIAEITGFPMGTVKSRISRARTKLRDFLLQQPELLPSSLRPKHR